MRRAAGPLLAFLVGGCVDVSPPRELTRVARDAGESTDPSPDLAAAPDHSLAGADGGAEPGPVAGPEVGDEADAGAPPDLMTDPGSPDLAPDLASPDLATPAPDLARDLGPPDAPLNTSAQLVLRWAFDETMGSLTADSSGNGYHGTYTGLSGQPATSTNVAPLTFANPASRLFDATKRHAVRLSSMPAMLKPTNNVTVMAWYRATTVDLNGGELISAGNSYQLRVLANHIEMAKRISGTWTECRAVATTHLDGKWHHLAGVSTPAGIKVYFDGVPQPCPAHPGDNIVYDQGTDLWVGRHGRPESNQQLDFSGHIDEVRIYRRALTDSEVAALAKGHP